MYDASFYRWTRTVLVATAFAIVLTGGGIAASPFEGTWQTQDSQGKPFEITLSNDGSAKGSLAGDNMSGTWKTEGDSVVITWGDSGWTTKINKEGDKYKKTTFKDGKEKGPATDVKKVE